MNYNNNLILWTPHLEQNLSVDLYFVEKFSLKIWGRFEIFILQHSKEKFNSLKPFNILFQDKLIERVDQVFF